MNLGKHTFPNDKTIVMGILNVTPDSFSDGGQFFDPKKAVEHAKQMVRDGANIIDIGGESTRPGSEEVSKDKELKRVRPVIEILKNEIDVPISIDTYKPEVAEVCIKSGATIVNDISGLRDQKMIELIAKNQIPVIIMHMKGTPKNMQQNPEYSDVVREIKHYLQEKKQIAQQAGIKDIVIDPGIGFGKTVENNLEILKRLHEFKDLECPILLGTSRKSFIGKITGLDEKERVEGTIASIVAGVLHGANIVRVHDVKACKRALQIVDEIKNV